MSMDVSRGAFEATLRVPAQTALGPHLVAAACGDVRAASTQLAVSVTVVPAKVDTPATPVITPPVASPVIENAETTSTETETTSAQPGSDKSETVGIGTISVVAGLLLAAGVGVFAGRRLRARPADPVQDHDPPPQQVHVRVVADLAPSTRLRMITHVPEIEVRIVVGRPQVTIREIPA
ncbi:hypothetical protein [Nocardia salmonicida]